MAELFVFKSFQVKCLGLELFQEKDSGNKSWLEDKLKNAKDDLTVKSGRLEREIHELEMNIEKL